MCWNIYPLLPGELAAAGFQRVCRVVLRGPHGPSSPACPLGGDGL